MTIAQNYFIGAELALAAYSDLFQDMVPNEYELVLRDNGKGLSLSHASTFASTYRVADRHFDSTGVSATIFADDKTKASEKASEGSARGQVSEGSGRELRK